jgi:two-component system, OmpR family, sensor histidine kinase CpxA
MMHLPKLNSLYGRIFAIFWSTMLLILIAALSLPHLDPRKTKALSDDELTHLWIMKSELEDRFAGEHDLANIITQLTMRFGHNAHFERDNDNDNDKPKFILVDINGEILNKQNRSERYRALQNFITGIDSVAQPQQRQYGRFIIAGPLPITLANQNLFLYIGLEGIAPPPFILHLLGSPFSLMLIMMLISTPLLLWLSWALSQPANRFAEAAQRVARGEFNVDPKLEQGTREFRQAGASFNRMVEAVNGMISGQQRLLSDISHELRSPLTRLRMANSLAVRKQGSSNELTRIDTEAQRLEQMIGELLELSRIQTNSHLSREEQPLSSLWQEMLEDAQFEAEQMSKQLSFSTIPERTILGTPKLLMSAIENVIRNAIYYGKDTISIHFKEIADTLMISVEDNGDGVPEDELNEIFRPFYRVSTARERHSGGTGLGLAITESAIRQHSGTIVAGRSNMGGLKIMVTLPLKTLHKKD